MDNPAKVNVKSEIMVQTTTKPYIYYEKTKSKKNPNRKEKKPRSKEQKIFSTKPYNKISLI